MRIALFNDLPCFQEGVGSGAELSIKAFIVEGIRRGHTVDCYTAQEFNRPLEGYDLVVAKNVVTFNEQQLQNMINAPLIHWPSDYAHCKWRLHYAMQEKCKTSEGLARGRALVQTSLLNVFLSPLHKDAYAFVIPELKDMKDKIHYSPPYVNPENFKPEEGVERLENTVVGVNCLLPFKGANNVVAYAAKNPERVFNFFGGAMNDWEKKLSSNALYHGYALQETLPNIYSQAEYFIELPNTPQPFNRTMIEATLCGIEKFILNNNIGAYSYRWMKKPKRDKVVKVMEKTLPDLWRKMEAMI